ncbi:hypothetical protein EVAR_55026_1 [Eumeta japonica]|uniref:Uncharacterized protein n=1 Tax=Eumeta variegata TaxID=151549 RepID=A0A4C1YF20_EUMVA|nr:hypothetical protein EVAR_55026_1 [Eumeta japonica]
MQSFGCITIRGVQVSQSGAHQVVLRGATRALSGRYRCEVSADAPFFHTDYKSAYMRVVGKHCGGATTGSLLKKSLLFQYNRRLYDLFTIMTFLCRLNIRTISTSDVAATPETIENNTLNADFQEASLFSSNVPHLLSQGDLNDLVSDFNLSKQQELWGSRLTDAIPKQPKTKCLLYKSFQEFLISESRYHDARTDRSLVILRNEIVSVRKSALSDSRRGRFAEVRAGGAGARVAAPRRLRAEPFISVNLRLLRERRCARAPRPAPAPAKLMRAQTAPAPSAPRNGANYGAAPRPARRDTCLMSHVGLPNLFTACCVTLTITKFVQLLKRHIAERNDDEETLLCRLSPPPTFIL